MATPHTAGSPLTSLQGPALLPLPGGAPSGQAPSPGPCGPDNALTALHPLWAGSAGPAPSSVELGLGELCGSAASSLTRG